MFTFILVGFSLFYWCFHDSIEFEVIQRRLLRGTCTRFLLNTGKEGIRLEGKKENLGGSLLVALLTE